MDAIKVGTAIMAKALSMTFNAKSKEVIEKINTKIINMY